MILPIKSRKRDPGVRRPKNNKLKRKHLDKTKKKQKTLPFLPRLENPYQKQFPFAISSQIHIRTYHLFCSGAWIGICSGMLSEKAMAPHSRTLAWRVQWMEEPGRLQSMRSLRVRHDWVTSLSLFTFMHWRRKWQLTPVFLPGESQGQGSLVGCLLWGRKESDTTEATQQQQQQLACYHDHKRFGVKHRIEGTWTFSMEYHL